MSELRAVEEPREDPKSGKPRPTSDTRFPYYDLADVIEVAKTVREKAGGLCDKPQLATLLGHKGVKSGAFLSRIAAAKMFGLVEQAEGGKFRLSRRGQAIVAPQSEASATDAKIAAFMDVELFKKVFQQYHGTTLPEEIGLRNLIETEYGVVESRVVPTVRIMLDSAKQAGLLNTEGKGTRMVRPLASEADQPPPAPKMEEDGVRFGGGGGNGGSGGDDFKVDPFLLEFLKKLPESGTSMSAKRRDVLVKGFGSALEVVYPDMEDE
jgi:hypothetical protein